MCVQSLLYSSGHPGSLCSRPECKRCPFRFVSYFQRGDLWLGEFLLSVAEVGTHCGLPS
jgi:hypothetical protein